MIFTKYKEGVRAIRAIKYKKYVAGKYARARASLVREYTNRILESKDVTTSMKIVNKLKDTTFASMICLTSSIVLKYRLIKYRNELLGHPVYFKELHNEQECY